MHKKFSAVAAEAAGDVIWKDAFTIQRLEFEIQPSPTFLEKKREKKISRQVIELHKHEAYHIPK